MNFKNTSFLVAASSILMGALLFANTATTNFALTSESKVYKDHTVESFALAFRASKYGWLDESFNCPIKVVFTDSFFETLVDTHSEEIEFEGIASLDVYSGLGKSVYLTVSNVIEICNDMDSHQIALTQIIFINGSDGPVIDFPMQFKAKILVLRPFKIESERSLDEPNTMIIEYNEVVQAHGNVMAALLLEDIRNNAQDDTAVAKADSGSKEPVIN